MQITGHIRAVLLACLAVLSSAPAHAEDAIVTVTLAGEAYDGPPKFRFIADNRIIGTAEIANALDTAKGERLRFQGGTTQSGTERFLFAVPDIETVSQLDIEFINDAWAGKDKPGDRNLYLLSLSLSTVRKTASGSVAATHDFSPLAFQSITRTPQGADITAQFAALYQEGRLRLKRPEGGWTAAAADILAPKTETATAAKSASTLPCPRSRLELKGFEKNTTRLPPAMLEQLAKAGKALHGTSCSARITAYASGGSSQAFRAQLSRERAQAVANELIRLGLAAERIKMGSAPGGGRRVVVSFE